MAQDTGILNLQYPSLHSQQYGAPRLRSCETLNVHMVHQSQHWRLN